MEAFTPLLTGYEDRARVLTEILEAHPIRPGITLIAHVDRSTREVLAVRGIPTPLPPREGGPEFRGASDPTSLLLCAVAEEIVPARPWTGQGWGPITGELLTVVCRDGEATVGPTEWHLAWCWRYSNHGAAAFDGDVYVVTPQGWAGLPSYWSGDHPALPAGDGRIAPDASGDRQPDAYPAHVGPPGEKHERIPVPQDAEDVLATPPSEAPDPRPGECLPCYVHRMLSLFDCSGELRFVGHYRAVRAPRATGLERRLASLGGCCDCEIFLHGYDLRAEHRLPALTHDEDGATILDEDERWPDPLPTCTGVRAGSTQPCRLWQARS